MEDFFIMMGLCLFCFGAATADTPDTWLPFEIMVMGLLCEAAAGIIHIIKSKKASK